MWELNGKHSCLDGGCGGGGGGGGGGGDGSSVFGGGDGVVFLNTDFFVLLLTGSTTFRVSFLFGDSEARSIRVRILGSDIVVCFEGFWKLQRGAGGKKFIDSISPNILIFFSLSIS